MIERVEISGWQSLRSLELPLGRLSVIVGPSSCGKSALVRALRAVASNVRGASQITRGCKRTAITVRTGEHVITLERSAASGQYRLVEVSTGQERCFTKLGGTVPEHITQALGISPLTGGSSVNFAGQFDAPWLLGESGAVAARVIGSLTNITIIFNAVREANRRRSAQVGMLRARETDLASVVERIAEFTDLPYQRRICDAAEAVMAGVEADTERVRLLGELIADLESAETILQDPPSRYNVPSMSDLHVSQRALDRLTDEIWTVAATGAAADQAKVKVDAAVAAAQDHRAELRDALDRAGVCPVCQRPMT